MNSSDIVKNTLDQIPTPKQNAQKIIALVKHSGRITGYQLSNQSIISKEQAVQLAKQGEIAGVGIAHRGDTEYLKAIPNENENDNLSNLPTISAKG